jgi:hypothetical protein
MRRAARLVQRRRYVVHRNKRPALTSPWKIGFLVSLLLVTVSIGVGFAITRTFGVAWTWIHIGEGTWGFDVDAFLQQMLPLVVIVPVMSLFSYFVITGAVRKYRAYLDSGQDYKHLVKSIRQIDDLQEDRIKALGDYPELRDFLLKLRKRISDREQALDELESSLNARREEAQVTDSYKAEAGVLTGAINRGPVEGFAEELALSLPEMKKLEQAIRQRLLVGGASMAANDVGEQLSNIRTELMDSTAMLKDMIGELSDEMLASQNGARDIEMYLTQLKKTVAGGPVAAKAGENAEALALVQRLDQASGALSALGEETKSIAITAALGAGQGQGGLKDLVTLADSVRDVAARFNGVAGQYLQTGQMIKSVLQAGAGTGGDDQLTETLEAMADRVTYWVERVVILGEKLSAFEQQFVDVVAAFNAKMGGEQGDEKYQTVDDFTTAATPGSEMIKDPASSVGGGGELPESPGVVSEIAGLERNKSLFEEISGESEDNLFADIPGERAAGAPPPDGERHTGITGVFERNAFPSPTAEETGSREAPEPGLSVQPGTQVPPADVPRTGPAPEEPQFEEGSTGRGPEGAQPSSDLFEEMAPAPPAAQDRQPARAPAPPRAEPRRRKAPKAAQAEEEKIYDIYELGAVDYEPSVHTSA